MSSPASRQILSDVQANEALLQRCSRHNFLPIAGRRIEPRFRCSRCMGSAHSVERYWYDLGLKHATT